MNQALTYAVMECQRPSRDPVYVYIHDVIDVSIWYFLVSWNNYFKIIDRTDYSFSIYWSIDAQLNNFNLYYSFGYI